ncbi:MAG: hypothetical protein HUJ29_01375 [Gammaproteobacteria bacterium]|nr:hypothetical protein [Gammaproteobacteria bacterium]
MSSHDYSVLVGASGWEFPAWEDRLYPEDLPEDWRITYYSNEFSVVLLPLSRLAEADEEEVETWVEDTHDSFRFVLEIDQALSEGVKPRLRQLASKLLAVVVHCEEVTLPSELEGLPRVLEKVAAKHCELDLQHGMGHCWDGEGAPCWGDDIALVCLQAEQYKDMRKLKEIITRCEPALQQGRRLVLLFEGNAPDLEVMRGARTIAELLGY